MADPLSDLLSQKFTSGALVDSLPVGICCCDAEGRIQQFNRRAAELWGQDPPIGDSDHRFCGAFRLFRSDGSEMPHAETPMADVLRTGEPVRDRMIQILRPDGSTVMTLVNIDPLKGEDGALLGAVNCFQDVTELHRAREAGTAEERRLYALLEALPAAVYTTDAEGRLTFFNRAAVALAGRRPSLGDDRWCVTWRLYWPDGTEMAHSDCPMAVSLAERRALTGREAMAERPDGTRVPFLAYPTPLFDENGRLVGAVNMLVDITERKKAESDQRLLVNELNHRVKNTLATVQSIARQTLRRSRSPADFVESFAGRVDALAAAHTILTRQTWRGAELRDLIEGQVALDDTDGSRVVLSGPSVTLGAQTALHLALVLHELGTNARKYGALSAPEGRLEVAWDVESRPRRTLHITWRETGGPRVTAPTTSGFGSILIEKSLQSHGGEASIVYGGEGVSCEIRLALPAGAVSEPPAEEARRTEPALSEVVTPARDVLVGKRVLVVEDEPFLAMDIEAMLTDAGCKVIGPAQDYDCAIGLARQAEFDLALLDANLGGHPVDEVAAELTRRQIPFVFATGYGREGLPEAFRDAPLVSKPFSEHQLLQHLRRLTERDEALVQMPTAGHRRRRH